MSYTKQTWVTGDIVTAERLNYMEDGIAAGGGADLVIKSSIPLVDASSSDLQIISGSYTSAKTLMESGIPVTTCVYCNNFNTDNEYAKHITYLTMTRFDRDTDEITVYVFDENLQGYVIIITDSTIILQSNNTEVLNAQ